MKLVLAIINNDDSAVAANALTAGGFSVISDGKIDATVNSGKIWQKKK